MFNRPRRLSRVWLVVLAMLSGSLLAPVSQPAPAWAGGCGKPVRSGPREDRIIERFKDYRGCVIPLRRGYHDYSKGGGWGLVHIKQRHGWDSYRRNLTRYALLGTFRSPNETRKSRLWHCHNYSTPRGYKRTWNLLVDYATRDGFGKWGIITAYYKTGWWKCGTL